ncbi:uncharacterized protein [Ptychodera flava]|uniref:uncharacterized protein n=1 Tax=Ptychodera flava TaxID=63121 RepID=UPI00396A8B77
MSTCSCACLWRAFKTCWSRNCPCFDCFTGDCSGVCMIIICFCTIGVSLTLIGVFVLLKGYVFDDDNFVQVVGLVELSLGLFFCLLSCLGTWAFSVSRKKSTAMRRQPQNEGNNKHKEQASSSEYPTDIALQVIQNGVTPTGAVPNDRENCLEEVPPTPPLMGESPLDLYVHSGPPSEFGSASNIGIDNEPAVVMVKSRDTDMDNSEDNGIPAINTSFQLHSTRKDEDPKDRPSGNKMEANLTSEVSLVDAEDELI